MRKALPGRERVSMQMQMKAHPDSHIAPASQTIQFI